MIKYGISGHRTTSKPQETIGECWQCWFQLLLNAENKDSLSFCLPSMLFWLLLLERSSFHGVRVWQTLTYLLKMLGVSCLALPYPPISAQLQAVHSYMSLWLPIGLVPWESPAGEKRQEEGEVREVIPQLLPQSGSAAKDHGSHQEVPPDSSNCPLLAYSGIGMVMAAWGTVLSLAGFPKHFPIPLHVIHYLSSSQIAPVGCAIHFLVGPWLMSLILCFQLHRWAGPGRSRLRFSKELMLPVKRKSPFLDFCMQVRDRFRSTFGKKTLGRE